MSAGEFWRERRVLLTGHTGFKGSWLYLWLRMLGAHVTGFALPPATAPSLWALFGDEADSIIGDICDEPLVRETLRRAAPDIVIHMAAQALVRESYRDPVGTFRTNVLGTAILLDACRTLPRLQCVVVVTSDKVYANDGTTRAFEERDPLGGHDPYSASKACSELVAASFRDSLFAPGPPLATARAGNVVGGGDWAPDRLIPDCLRALDSGKPVRLRYPDAVRPWQHVLDPLAGYLMLAQALVETPQRAPRAVNFGPDPASFRAVSDVVEAFSERFAGKPGWVRDAGIQPPEAQALRLSSAVAERTLGWHARLGIAAALAWTADWYAAARTGEDMLRFSRQQIDRYRDAGRRPS